MVSWDTSTFLSRSRRGLPMELSTVERQWTLVMRRRWRFPRRGDYSFREGTFYRWWLPGGPGPVLWKKTGVVIGTRGNNSKKDGEKRTTIYNATNYILQIRYCTYITTSHNHTYPTLWLTEPSVVLGHADIETDLRRPCVRGHEVPEFGKVMIYPSGFLLTEELLRHVEPRRHLTLS